MSIKILRCNFLKFNYIVWNQKRVWCNLFGSAGCIDAFVCLALKIVGWRTAPVYSGLACEPIQYFGGRRAALAVRDAGEKQQTHQPTPSPFGTKIDIPSKWPASTMNGAALSLYTLRTDWFPHALCSSEIRNSF